MENFKSQGVTLCGDVLLISAFVSYVGYFTKKYRNELMEKFWIPYINKLKVRGTAVAMTQGDMKPHCHTGAPSALFAGIDVIYGTSKSCSSKHQEGGLLR